MLFSHHCEGRWRKAESLSSIPIVIYGGQFTIKDLPFFRKIEFFTACHHDDIGYSTPDQAVRHDNAGTSTGAEKFDPCADGSCFDPQIFRHQGCQMRLE